MSSEGKKSIINYDSQTNMRVVAAAVTLTAFLAGIWYGQNGRIDSLETAVNNMATKLDEINDTRWKAEYDLIYMQKFATVNGLELPPHPAEMK